LSSGVSENHLFFYRLKDLLAKGEHEDSDLEFVAGIGRCILLAPPCFSIGAQGVLFGECGEGLGVTKPASPHRLRSCAMPHRVCSLERAYKARLCPCTNHDGPQFLNTSTPHKRHVHDTGNDLMDPHEATRPFAVGTLVWDAPQRDRYREALCGHSAYEEKHGHQGHAVGTVL